MSARELTVKGLFHFNPHNNSMKYIIMYDPHFVSLEILRRIILRKTTPILSGQGRDQSQVFLRSGCPSKGLFYVPVAQQTLEGHCSQMP